MTTCSAPAVTRTVSGFQRVKALTGAADQDLHDWQWQYPIASGSPVTSTCTAPQEHWPLCVAAIVAVSSMSIRRFPDNQGQPRLRPTHGSLGPGTVRRLKRHQ